MITQPRLTLALAQMNPTLGDLNGNMEKLRAIRAKAKEQGAELILTPELSLTGYPPEDLVQKPAFVSAAMAAATRFAAETADNGPAILIGSPWLNEDKLHNAVLLCEGGRIAAIRFKHDLPNYGPFDEKRVFSGGPLPEPVLWHGIKLGLPICEDVWTPTVCQHLKAQGAEMLLVANGSPYELGKAERRREIAEARVKETGLPFIYLNQLGGQDELVFDGGTLVLEGSGSSVGQGTRWQECIDITTWGISKAGWQCLTAPMMKSQTGEADIYAALVTGLRDYVDKNHFPSVVLGMSGGIDSALVAAIAADALGPSRVRCVMMPSPYTSQDSLDDAADCARRLGCPYESISIEPAMKAYEQMLGGATGITAENIQSRARGMTLMALSNTTGAMVLSTGNKSELSVGYATLYGDMCGGFSVLKDVYKMTVYALARWRNLEREVIPQRILTKAPTAELRPDQKDEDSLPPYKDLDAILFALIEHEADVETLVKAGYAREVVLRVWKLLDRAEYKRRQAPPGVKISSRAFGKDRRYPITNGFTDLVTASA